MVIFLIHSRGKSPYPALWVDPQRRVHCCRWQHQALDPELLALENRWGGWGPLPSCWNSCHPSPRRHWWRGISCTQLTRGQTSLKICRQWSLFIAVGGPETVNNKTSRADDSIHAHKCYQLTVLLWYFVFVHMSVWCTVTYYDPTKPYETAANTFILTFVLAVCHTSTMLSYSCNSMLLSWYCLRKCMNSVTSKSWNLQNWMNPDVMATENTLKWTCEYKFHYLGTGGKDIVCVMI